MIFLIVIAVLALQTWAYFAAKPGGWVRRFMQVSWALSFMLTVVLPVSYWLWRTTLPEGVIAQCGVMRNTHFETVEQFAERIDETRLSSRALRNYARDVPWPTERSFRLRILEVDDTSDRVIFEYIDPESGDIFRRIQANGRAPGLGFAEVDEIYYSYFAGIAVWNLPGGVFHYIASGDPVPQDDLGFIEDTYGEDAVNGEASHWTLAQIAYAEGRFSFFSICRGTLDHRWARPPV